MNDKPAVPLVSVRGLVKRYAPGRVALHGVDLAAERGEIVGLLGRNGAGKTTLVGACTTRVRPTAGTVRLAGLDVTRHPSEVKRRIGVVPQHNTLDRSLHVGELLYWHCRYFNASRRAARTRTSELLELFELSDRRAESILALSGGLARRLQLAAAVAHDPEIVFLDEPTTGLDVEARKVFWERIRALADGGGCVLLTTHYLEEADQLSTRLAVLDHGRLIAEGSPDQLRDRVGADTTIRVELERCDERAERQICQIAGITHVTRDRNRIQLLARHRHGLIAELTAALLPAGLIDLAVDKASLEHLITVLTPAGRSQS
jgi:ABC-2 type transport system ATP-binding protein